MTYRRRASATDNSAVIERLERERDELLAQCERLRGYIGQVMAIAAHPLIDREYAKIAKEALNETPQTSLREIQAEAVKGVTTGARKSWTEGDRICFEARDINEYADHIRRGEDG